MGASHLGAWDLATVGPVRGNAVAVEHPLGGVLHCQQVRDYTSAAGQPLVDRVCPDALATRTEWYASRRAESDTGKREGVLQTLPAESGD